MDTEHTYDLNHAFDSLFGVWNGPAIGLLDLDAFFASVEQLDHPEQLFASSGAQQLSFAEIAERVFAPMLAQLAKEAS